jgi:predicted enzyme related to lactoylglutathione lyase
MMQILVNIDVDDLTRAVDFYTRAFELTVGRRMGADFVELLGASSALYLLVKAAGTTPCRGAVRSYARHWTPVHMDLVVHDLDAAIVRVLAAGATQEGQVETHAYGRLAFFADPFGNGFCLLQFTGRGYDEISDSRRPDDALCVGAFELQAGL